MGVNLYNRERYVDPTAYEAIGNVERESKKQRKPIVFICSPFAGDIAGNIKRARSYGRFAVSEGVVPIIPHLMYPQFLVEDNPKERQLGIEMGLILLSKCKKIWVFGDVISAGMKLEINKAKKYSMPIQYFTTDCKRIGG
ncbi:DUF4406 domain-containing protein [Clostridium autoethanogenum]|uniref:DUF4406 domain-containing protein n=1 Tax=Clostridium autoethanogenum TaxID=84023 RepID=A0A3M0SZN0_9CLOT|nr:DUF4406 domain-containing protein [Clostridium autoethanogenum]RMD03222.1 DUF4406 domain-containing protein [Clostridium autoethanogenum]